MNRPPAEAGFTLIELIISLALFALISLAGVVLVESLMSIQHRTDGRLDRAAQVQRAMFVIDNDISQIAGGPIFGEGATVEFGRPVAAIGGTAVRVRYELAGGSLIRSFDANGQHNTQLVLPGVRQVQWRYFTREGGWIGHWPASPDQADKWPAAIAGDIVLAPGNGLQGSLSKIVALPVKP